MESVMEKKTVSISQKRQFTIPAKFFEALGFDTEAECMIRGSELVIRPVKQTSGGEFAEQILAELIAQGLTGAALLVAFKERQAQMRRAVDCMLLDAEQAAEGKAEYVTYEEIFGSGEEK